MLMGIQLQAHPSKQQKLTLSQWMGCARFIWNAKCDEDRYLRIFAKKFLPVGSYEADQTTAQFKDNEQSPWLSDCPSQILRNSAANWYKTHRKFLKGDCGRPNPKRKSDGGSIHLTRELFRFEKCEDGVTRLFIGAKKNNIGYLAIRLHRPFGQPKSIYIKKLHGQYFVSFCYEDDLDESALPSQKDHLAYLRGAKPEYLVRHTVGIDRGVVRPIQAGEQVFDLSAQEKRKKLRREKYVRRYQRKLSRQKKGSRHRYRTKEQLSIRHSRIANVRKDFCHKASRAIVDNDTNKILIFEDLRTKNMTARPKAKKSETGKWERNGARSKAGLNKAILDKGWHQLEAFIKYKSHRAGKAWFKVPAHHTSQECAVCSHTHPDNRRSQSRFHCESCGHTDNADRNAAEVIKKRAIKLILDPGSGLSKRGVLLTDTGRGATVKSRGAKASRARGDETSKKRKRAAKAA